MKTLVLVFTLLLASPAFAQTPTDKLSPDEIQEAQKLARTFSRRLLRTKDITPLIDEYFVSDFLNGYLQDKDESWFMFLDRNIATQVSRAELRRYFIAELNWLYLAQLYMFSKYSSCSDMDLPLEKTFPADVLRLFRSDSRRNVTIGEKDVDDLELRVDTLENFPSFVEKLEHGTHLLRKHAVKINAGHTPQYRETFALRNKLNNFYEPWLSVCEQQWLTLPKGTRVIGITVPSIELHLAKVNGRMRIVSAWFLID